MILDFFKNLSPVELAIIVIVLILLFGGKKIASLGRASGETVKEIKKIKKEIVEPFEEIKNQS